VAQVEPDSNAARRPGRSPARACQSDRAAAKARSQTPRELGSSRAPRPGMVLAVALGMAIARVLRRYFGGIVVGLIAALAFFQGRGAAQLLGMALRGPGPRSSQLPSPALPPPAVESTHRAQVSQRSPFDSSSVAMTSAPAPAHYAGAAFSDPLAWPACDGVRVSIVIESSNPAWSLSTMQASGEPSARLRRLGDDVAGKRVAFIGYNPRQLTPSVWLQSNERARSSACACLAFDRARY
jgi:hypothetical protein